MLLHVDSLFLLLLLVRILQEDALCSKTIPFCAMFTLAKLRFGVAGSLVEKVAGVMLTWAKLSLQN